MVTAVAGALLIAACSGGSDNSAVGDTAVGGSEGGDADPSDTLPEVSAPIIDVADPAGSMIEAELALRAEDRERAGVVNLGPGVLDLLAAMDASVALAC